MAAFTAKPRLLSPPPAVQFECEDLLADAATLEALGVGLGRAEMYGVLLAVKALGEDPKRGVATARFFGKVLGTCADYYVFETTLQSLPEEAEQPLGEQAGHRQQWHPD